MNKKESSFFFLLLVVVGIFVRRCLFCFSLDVENAKRLNFFPEFIKVFFSSSLYCSFFVKT